jgi:hypothetical protein
MDGSEARGNGPRREAEIIAMPRGRGKGALFKPRFDCWEYVPAVITEESFDRLGELTIKLLSFHQELKGS